MAVSMPKRTEWQTLKKKHGVGSNAVRSVNVGKALDEYWKKLGTPKVNMQNAAATETILVKYITSFKQSDKKGKHKAFVTEFMTKILGECKKVHEEMKQMSGGVAAYEKAVLGLVSGAQQLKATGTTKQQLERFKSGPLRKLGAVGSNTGGFDQKGINALAGKLNRLIDKTPGDAQQSFLDKLVATILADVVKIEAEFRKQTK